MEIFPVQVTSCSQTGTVKGFRDSDLVESKTKLSLKGFGRTQRDVAVPVLDLLKNAFEFLSLIETEPYSVEILPAFQSELFTFA